MRPRLPLLAFLCSATVVSALACQDKEIDPQTKGSPGAGAAGGGKGFGSPDVATTTAIGVLEDTLRGSVRDGQLTVRFRLLAKQGTPSGSLSVSLRSLDDADGGAPVAVPYDLPAQGDQELTATVPVPASLATLEDRVLQNVRIEGDGVRVTRSLFEVLAPLEVALDGPTGAVTGKPTKVVARVRHPRSLLPVAGAPVNLSIKRAGVEVTTLSGTSDERGDAVFDVALAETGAHELSASSPSEGTPVTIASPVVARAPGSKLLLTTDKPIYQPGQAMHLRALALAEQGNTPLPDQPVLFEVKDGKGNKVYKRALTSDAFGIAAATFRLGSVVNTGTYKITTTVGAQTTEKSVTVGAYALPKFKTTITPDRPYYGPGDVVTATVDAAYFFGKLVAGGDVTIEAATIDVGENVFQTVQGKLDAAGRYGFSVTLPKSLAGLPLDGGKGLVVLRAKVRDTAGQEVVKEQTLTIAKDGVDVALVPEGTRIVPGLENQLDLFLSDPLGAPIASTAVAVDAYGEALTVTTDAEGHAALTVTPADNQTTGSSPVKVSFTSPSGKAITRSFTFGRQAGGEHLALRTDKAIYDVGDTVDLTIRTTDPAANVYVSWLANGQVADITTLKAVEGKATYTRALDATTLGANRLEAYVVDDTGQIVRSARTVVVRNKGALKVGIAAEKASYLPGEQAKLTLSVTDETGAPAVAALGVQIVDEAVFGLVESRPGLLRTYFELDRAFAEPNYEIHGPAGSFEGMLFGGAGETDPQKVAAQQTKASAALAALGNASPGLSSVASWGKTFTAAKQLQAPFIAKRRSALVADLSTATKKAVADLAAVGCSNAAPSKCLETSYPTTLQKKLQSALSAYDFWGTAYKVDVSGNLGVTMTSAGPNEKLGDPDDHQLTFSGHEIGAFGSKGSQGKGGTGGSSAGMGGPNAGAGEGEGGIDVDDGDAGDPSPAPPDGGIVGGSGEPPAGNGAEPRVRKDFPETLFVAPAVITGPDGKAELSIPLADSITTWRVSTLANSAQGKLGGDVGGIQVFTDFFTDIAFPAELTRGDEVTFPVAVYNYLDSAQTVTLELSGGDWYTALGPQSFTVTLAAGEVKGVQVPVRAEKVGVQSLTVKAKGTQKSDAVQRIVRVVPDGKEESRAFSGALSAGSTEHTASFPALAVAGSEALHLDVYPQSFSQIVSGIDSILKTPSGCFEQTTSTTWPNVLALKYMDGTKQGTPEIRLKAESLINAGYQRLLTFEHPGGGFSWFGTQDPKPNLSVTAFGVLEFADMATVSSVDPALLARTSTWLANQQKADGSYEPGQTEFFSINAGAVRNTAFVTWALVAAGYQGPQIQSGLAYVKDHLGADEKDGGDAYTLGVVANAFVAAAPNDAFTGEVLAKLEAAKKMDGDKVSWSSGGTQSSFYEGGGAADLSATAIVAHAFLAASAYPSSVAGALATIAAKRDPQGNFGATQSTVWSLRLLTLAATKGTESAVGTLEVDVDGAPFTSLSFTEADGDVLRRVDLASLAKTGDHVVKLVYTGTGKPSYSLVQSHHVPWASVPNAPTGPLAVSVAYDRTSLVVDETVEATVTLQNLETKTQHMVHATLGIPPGFEVLGEDFAEELASKKLSKWESTAKQVDLYVPTLSPKGELVVKYRLRATMPIKAEDGGAKVFPYYQPEQKSTAASVTLVVASK